MLYPFFLSFSSKSMHQCGSHSKWLSKAHIANGYASSPSSFDVKNSVLLWFVQPPHQSLNFLFLCFWFLGFFFFNIQIAEKEGIKLEKNVKNQILMLMHLLKSQKTILWEAQEGARGGSWLPHALQDSAQEHRVKAQLWKKFMVYVQ